MRNWIIGVAAALAVMAAPSVAVADSAEVGVAFGNIDVTGGDFDTLRLDGAYSHTMNNGLVLQLDGAHDRSDFGGGAELGSGYGAVNLGMRNEQWAIYGFAGLSDQVALSGTNVGIGGQLYLGKFTINGSAGWSDFEAGDFSITNVSVDAMYYITPDIGVGAEASLSEGEFSPDVEWTTLGANVRWRISGSPFTVTGSYQNIDPDSAGSDEVDAWRIGLVYNIGTGSEQERSQSGASWDGARRLYEASFGLFY